jgi:serine/threonine-protein kinase
VVENEGRFDFVKLLDFGVAKFNEDNLGPGLKAKTGMVFGTPHYMSPETAQGLPVDHRSDIYALGILFYEMLAGVVPFESDSPLEILNGHVSGKVPSLIGHESGIDVDPATNATILRCLEKRPEDRFQSMDELCGALRDCFTDRVFLRDAERLPGAVEAGIVPPPRPTRPPEEPGAPQPAAPQPETAPTGGQRRKRLTDELAELFAKPVQRGAAPQTDAPVELKPKRSGEQPAVERSKTQAGLGAVRLPTPAATDGSRPRRKRRQTEPLASKTKDR